MQVSNTRNTSFHLYIIFSFHKLMNPIWLYCYTWNRENENIWTGSGLFWYLKMQCFHMSFYPLLKYFANHFCRQATHSLKMLWKIYQQLLSADWVREREREREMQCCGLSSVKTTQLDGARGRGAYFFCRSNPRTSGNGKIGPTALQPVPLSWRGQENACLQSCLLKHQKYPCGIKTPPADKSKCRFDIWNPLQA